MTPAQLEKAKAQSCQFALDIAGLLDGQELPIPVVLHALLLTYQSLAHHLTPQQIGVASFALAQLAGDLAQQHTRPVPGQPLH